MDAICPCKRLSTTLVRQGSRDDMHWSGEVCPSSKNQGPFKLLYLYRLYRAVSFWAGRELLQLWIVSVELKIGYRRSLEITGYHWISLDVHVITVITRTKPEPNLSTSLANKCGSPKIGTQWPRKHPRFTPTWSTYTNNITIHFLGVTWQIFHFRQMSWESFDVLQGNFRRALLGLSLGWNRSKIEISKRIKWGQSKYQRNIIY